MNTPSLSPVRQWELEHLSDAQRADIKAVSAIGRRMQKYSHLKEWLRYGPILLIARQYAFDTTGANDTESWDYKMAYRQWMEDHPDIANANDGKAFSRILWLYSGDIVNDRGETRLDVLWRVLNRLPIKKRTGINHPHSAAKLVRECLAQEAEAAEEPAAKEDRPPEPPNSDPAKPDLVAAAAALLDAHPDDLARALGGVLDTQANAASMERVAHAFANAGVNMLSLLKGRQKARQPIDDALDALTGEADDENEDDEAA